VKCFFVQSDSVSKGCLIDQGSYYSLAGKSNDLRLFLQMKNIERKNSRKYTEEDCVSNLNVVAISNVHTNPDSSIKFGFAEV
jgi:hypothetical protein